MRTLLERRRPLPSRGPSLGSSRNFPGLPRGQWPRPCRPEWLTTRLSLPLDHPGPDRRTAGAIGRAHCASDAKNGPGNGVPCPFRDRRDWRVRGGELLVARRTQRPAPAGRGLTRPAEYTDDGGRRPGASRQSDPGQDASPVSAPGRPCRGTGESGTVIVDEIRVQQVTQVGVVQHPPRGRGTPGAGSRSDEHQGALRSDPAEEAGEDEGDHGRQDPSDRPQVPS